MPVDPAPEPEAPDPGPIAYHYHPAILAELARHGLAPRPDTPPGKLREQINDLYRFEIRTLRDRCRAGEIPVQQLSAHVIELRKRYTLLSIPMDRWHG
jgi:hypothetical protein